MKRLLKFVDLVNGWIGKMVSYLALIMLVTIVYEVIARYAFNRPTLWVMEYNGYLLCAYSLLASGYTLLNKAHVSVDVLYSRFHYRTKAITDCFTWLLFFVFVGTVVYFGSGLAYEAFVKKEAAASVLETPLFPVKAMIPIGSALLFLQGMVKFVRDLETAITGREPEDIGEGGIFGRIKKG